MARIMFPCLKEDGPPAMSQIQKGRMLDVVMREQSAGLSTSRRDREQTGGVGENDGLAV